MDSHLSSKRDSVCVLYRTMSSGEDVRTARECEEHCKVSIHVLLHLEVIKHPHTLLARGVRWLVSRVIKNRGFVFRENV